MARRGENIYKRKDGRWEGRYKNGIKPDGKTKYSSVYGKSYSEVKSLLAEKRKNVDRTATVCLLTVKELFGLWFEHLDIMAIAGTLAEFVISVTIIIVPHILSRILLASRCGIVIHQPQLLTAIRAEHKTAKWHHDTFLVTLP